jgi:hypothetical protein
VPPPEFGADQHPPPRPDRHLRQRPRRHLDVLTSGARSGVAGPQHDGQCFAAGSGTVISERGQRVEPERLLPRRLRLFLFRVREHDRGVDIHRDQASVTARRVIAGQRPGSLPGCSPRGADCLQLPRRIGCQSRDQPGHHRVRGHRALAGGADLPVPLASQQFLHRLRAGQRGPGGEREGEVRGGAQDIGLPAAFQELPQRGAGTITSSPHTKSNRRPSP